MSSGHSEFDRVKSHFERTGELPSWILADHLQELIDGCQPGDDHLREALEAEKGFSDEY